MACTNQKSSLSTVNTAAQTLAANGYLAFTANNLKTGVAISHVPGATTVGLIKGLYLVTVGADVVPTANGDIVLQLVNNGVAIPGAKATFTGTTTAKSNVGISTVVRVLPSCAVINNNANLQVQISAAGTVSNAIMNVVKLA